MDTHARTSERRTEVLPSPDRQEPAYLHPLRTILHKVFPLSYHPCHQQTVRMEGRIFFRRLHRPHQMPVRYERYRYHRTSLHRNRM